MDKCVHVHSALQYNIISRTENHPNCSNNHMLGCTKKLHQTVDPMTHV